MSPSGMVWTMRRISIQAYVATGKLPFSVSLKMAEMAEARDPESVFATLTTEEQYAALRFLQHLVREAVVDPKIVADAKNDDEIDEILPEDFTFLINEVTGGAEAERLGTFRSEGSGPVPVAGSRRKAVRKKAQ